MLARILRAAAAQMGPTQKADSRGHTLARMLKLLEAAAARGASLMVFPELAFTTLLPAVAARGRGARSLLRARHAESGRAAVVRPRPGAPRRLLCRLRRTDGRRPALQCVDACRSRRRRSRPLSQGASAGFDRAAPRRALPAA